MKTRTLGTSSRTSSLAIGALVLSLATPASAEMSFNVEKLSANGMEVRNLSCKLQQGGFFGPMVIVAELAKYKKAFDQCAPGGAAFATEFTWKGGKARAAKVTASSDASAESCVTATLKKTKATVSGTCSAVLLAGDVLKAQEAAAALSKKE
jgi:hypothetical protein